MTHGDDRRVQFDFEVDFSNGGGIQGQGFRLDIDDEDIDDEALAAYIVRDLRLLMVADTRILNKRVIRERHKRAARAGAAAPGADGRTRIDLSHTVEDGMVTYRGLPEPVIADFLTREQSRAQYDPGTEFQIGRIDMCSNTGTYLDSPFHRYAHGDDLAALSLDRLADLDAVRVDVTDTEGPRRRSAHVRALRHRGQGSAGAHRMGSPLGHGSTHSTSTTRPGAPGRSTRSCSPPGSRSAST
jgi:arylformamidase